MLQKYELLLILPGTLDEKEAQTTSNSLIELIKSYGSEVELTALGKNRLAYPVKQIRYGYFYTVVFSAEGNQLAALQEKLRLHREVLRFMISHFNTHLSTEQKAAYLPGNTGMAAGTTPERVMEKAPEEKPIPEEKMEKKVTPSQKEKKVDLDEVKKKLDKILEETDVIQGV